MAVNTAADFIKSVFPSVVNKRGGVFQALLCDDEGGGTLEGALADLETSRSAWQGASDDLYNQTGEQLERTRAALSPFDAHPSDTDDQTKRLLRTLFYRTGDTLWGSVQNVINCVRYYLDIYNVHIVNDTAEFEYSLLSNGDFESSLESDGELTPVAWSFEGSAEYASAADWRFEGAYGAHLAAADGVVSQSATLAAGSDYALHWFLSGAVRVAVLDSAGLYWNATSLEWQEEACYVEAASSDWEGHTLRFTTGEAGDYTVCFCGAEDGSEGGVDYVSLNKVETGAATFSLVCVYDGVKTVITTGAYYAPSADIDADGDGEVTSSDFEAQSLYYHAPEDDTGLSDYEGVAFYPGVAGSLTAWILEHEILRVLKPAGVTAFVELLTKDGESTSDSAS